MTITFPKPLIFTLALLQGIVLTALYRSVEMHVWPATELPWLYALLTFSFCFPLLVLFCINQSNTKHTLKIMLIFALVLSAIGAYVGLQHEPAEFINNHTSTAIFYLCMLIALFKGLMYVQQYLTNQAVTYYSLFKLSWRNFIVFAESWLFVGIFWGILHLGASLFAILNITLFKDLLDQDWFVIPTLTFALSFAVILFRHIIHTADTIAAILQTLIKFLLPVLAIISIGFMATLPFTGLSTLWQTGSGSLILLWLQALTLFFVNAVYQDEGNERPYRLFIHRLVFISIALLPVYSTISAYGLWLRIEQYGLTVERCSALLIWAILACFAFGYLFGIVKYRDAWLSVRCHVNVLMGKVVLVTALLINTPVLNFQSLSVNSQLARLDDSQITLDEFDFQYVEHSLGRQGYLAMQSLKAQLSALDAKHTAVIERMYASKLPTDIDGYSQLDFEHQVTYWPNKDAIPESLLAAIYKQKYSIISQHPSQTSYYLIAQDLDHDGQNEYIEVEEDNYSTAAFFWTFERDQWRSTYMTTFNREDNNVLKFALQENQISVERPKFDNLRIGEVVFIPPHE